jgi:phosphoenolpyruvate carboxylase
VPFFQSLLSTLEMALYKSDLGVAERYLQLVEPELRDRFWPDIAREHDQVIGPCGLLGLGPPVVARP